MADFENNAFFWQKIDTLYLSNKLEILREKGAKHPDYSNLVYPVSYGRLKDTQASTTEGITVFKGSLKASNVQALIIAADILKKDLQTKLLLGCTAEEEEKVLRFLNQTDFQKTVLIRRGTEIPNWGISD
ncbi:Inorganic pyrophosphatase [Anaerorhabdus sp.]|jgi:inorganic pyrophosphatase|uniref:Inorganic pyrophosphatase n=1 Tax=Anaerorhabdus sp. TaxID=1872524 RepID=UPI002FC76E5A